MHGLIAEHLPDPGGQLDPRPDVVVGIETDRGSSVASLMAAGYQSFAIKPLNAARYRQCHSTPGAESDAANAHLLAEIVRIDRDNHQPSPVTVRWRQGSTSPPEPIRARSGNAPPRAATAQRFGGVLSLCTEGVQHTRRPRCTRAVSEGPLALTAQSRSDVHPSPQAQSPRRRLHRPNRR